MMTGSMIQCILVIAMAVGHIYGSPLGLSNHRITDELAKGGSVENGRAPTIGEVITAANNGRDDVMSGEDLVGAGENAIDVNGLDAAVENGRTPTIADVITAVNDGGDDVIDATGEDNIGNGGDRKRALRLKSYFWPNGTIPYKLHDYFSLFDWMYPAAEAKIRSAMDIWKELTCLKFVHSPNAGSGDSHVLIYPGTGCSSAVGWHTGRQGLSLASGCMREDIIVHELGHTIGYSHEQNRYDRNEYVTVNLTHVPERWRHNFQPLARADSTDVGVPYDYRSIMHYPARIRPEWGTIITTKDTSFQDKIGAYTHLSFGDIKGINLAYKCADHCPNSCPEDAYLDKDCQCMCHDSTQSGNRRATVPCADIPPEPTTTPRSTQPPTTTSTSAPTTPPPTTPPPTTPPATTPPPAATTPTVTCVDERQVCATFASYCDHGFFNEFMVEKCKRTCNLCDR